MKTYKNLYRQIYPFGSLYQAFRAARKGKRDRAAVASFEFDLEQNLLALQRELESETYRPGPYTNFYITNQSQFEHAARQMDEIGRLIGGWQRKNTASRKLEASGKL